MNALELSDVIEKFVLDGATDLVCVYDSVIMLRQQQAEIVALNDQIREKDVCLKLLATELRKAQEK
jgi:hypothetical protein